MTYRLTCTDPYFRVIHGQTLRIQFALDANGSGVYAFQEYVRDDSRPKDVVEALERLASKIRIDCCVHV